MRNFSKILLFVGVFVGCTSSNNQPPKVKPETQNLDTARASNETSVEKLPVCDCQITPLHSRGQQHWFNVSGFDGKKSVCFTELEAWAKQYAKSKYGQLTFHFFDNLPDFKPPSDGRSNYGGEAIMNQEIMIYERMGGQEFIRFDNWETGKYTFPK